MFAPLLERLRREQIVFQENALVAPHLYFRIGGPVSVLVSPASAGQMAMVLGEIASRRLPFVVIGGGSNIVFGDDPTRAVVILIPAPAKTGASRLDQRTVRVEGGVRNQLFLAWCAASGVGGLEFLSGIPGTMGGAAAVNAGAFGRSMAEVMLGAEIIDEAGVGCTVDAAHFAFHYRDSRFKFGCETVLALRLRCDPGEEAAITKKIRDNLEYRLRRHPSYRLASAGCFFKNPLVEGVKTSAGKIIEECGLKNAACGDLAVAQAHANFLLNRGRGTFADLQRLEEKIAAAVFARTGIALEREVIYVSRDGKKY